MLHLDARIHLDEIEVAAVRILQELDRAGVDVGHGAPDGKRRRAQSLAPGIIEEHCRRALHDLLVASLHGAIAFVHVHKSAMGVAEDLHFHVARAPHEFLEIHLVVAEGRERLAPGEG